MLEVKEEYLDEIEIEEIVEESIINETDWIEETLTLDKSTQIYDENMIIPSLSEPKIAASCESLKNEIVAKTTTIGTTDDNNLDGPLEIFNYTLPNNDDLNKEKIIELEPQSYEIEPSTLRDIINSVKIVNNDDASTNDNEPPEKKLKLSVSGDKPKINQTNQNITNPSTQQQTVKKIIKASVFELADESICMTCDKRFKAETNLIDHMKLVHNCNLILKKFNICHICNTPLSTANVLKRHIESVHTNKRKYKCDFCDKTFNYMEALQSHRRIHTGDRKYVCEICGLGFVSNSALKVLFIYLQLHTKYIIFIIKFVIFFLLYLQGHQNSKNAHTAAMNFECDICNQQFKTKLNLTQHIKLHFKADKDLEIEPFYSNQNSSSSLAGATKKVGSKNVYECKSCADTFTNKKEFVTHDRKHKRLLEEIKNLERVNLEMKKKVLLSSIGKNVMSTNFCKFSEA